MRSRRTDRFKTRLARLPPSVQRQALEAYRLFRDDPWHNSLHFKRLRHEEEAYSARVGDHYRVVGIREGDLITWFWIGSHSEYDKLIERL